MRPLLPACFAAILALHSSASAQPASGGRRVLVAGFTGELSGPTADAPALLGKVMADVVEASGDGVRQAPLDDVLGLVGCGEPTDECLGQNLSMLEVDHMVLGEVEATPDGASVHLRLLAASGPARTRTIQLRGASGGELARSFREPAAAFWRDPDQEPAAEEPEPVAAPVQRDTGGDRPGFSASRVRPYAWGIAGGGVGVLAVGGLLLWLADGKQEEVDSAPTETVEDFEALTDLEDSGRRYARFGSAFVVVGAVATIAGVVLVLKQGSDRDRDEAEGAPPPEPEITLAPALLPGGAGLTLTIRNGW